MWLIICLFWFLNYRKTTKLDNIICIGATILQYITNKTLNCYKNKQNKHFIKMQSNILVPQLQYIKPYIKEVEKKMGRQLHTFPPEDIFLGIKSEE